MNRLPVLLVDDDAVILKRMERLLRCDGYEDILVCQDARHVASIIAERDIGVMVLDLVMPEMGGQRVLQQTRERHPEIPVIVATSLNDLDSAVDCMRQGAFDYVSKTAEDERLIASVKHALSIRELQRDYSALKASFLGVRRPGSPAFDRIITGNARMLSVLRYVETLADSPKPILIMGESGTGKELVAEAVHAISGRRGKLVCLNIAGLDEAMFSDSLFGHKRGAFTGADADRGGLIERAGDGTLFLDEIGELSASSQVKLLRLIEDKLYYPVGSDKPKLSSAAIVTATNRNLCEASKSGTFRLDLFYRLQTHLVHLPPLRERLDDLRLLVPHFVESACARMGRPVLAVPDELILLLEGHDFPGNIRELESMIYDAVSVSKGAALSLASFREKIKVSAGDKKAGRGEASTPPLFAGWSRLPTLRESSDALIQEAIRRAGGKQGLAAGMLGISRTALNKRLRAGHPNPPRDYAPMD